MKRIVILGMALIALLSFEGVLANSTRAQSAGAAPPAPPVKLIFIHHSTGENWLADGYGNLGRELANNNYFVSDTNYGWGPDGGFLTSSSPPGTNRLMPGDFTYLGAFRLPGDETRPQTFAYGGSAMTFNPDGNPRGPADGFPGSLFVMGHDRMPYGELPDGNQVAELSIPAPVSATSVDDLNQAEFLQPFRNVARGLFATLDEIPKVGMAYLNHPATGPKLHIGWGQHFQFEDSPTWAPSHGWLNPDLAHPNPQGFWYIGNQSLYSVNDYLFTIPTAWADRHASGRYLATGRYRGGGWSGQGPALFAYRPWIDAAGTPAAPGTRLAETVLLLYENSWNSEDVVSRTLRGYQHADEWEGGAWITTADGRSAVLFAGTKSTGAKYWYGFMNPRGPEYPCVDQHVTDFVTCRMANGAACPPEDFAGCCDEALGNCLSLRGWWSTRFDAQFLLYDPADLARVAAGELEAWRPQPYATVDLDQYLYLNPPPWEEIVVGTGDQRRYRIGDVAYDRAHNLLYVLEHLADGGKPVVHVWRVDGGGGDPATTLITHYYVSILERTPEPDGLAFWQGLVAERQARGEDVKPVFRWMAEFFFFSPEYLGRDTTDRQFITNLYLTFFQRAPDEGGYAWWLDQLARGMTRHHAMNGFLHSQEFTDFMEALGF